MSLLNKCRFPGFGALESLSASRYQLQVGSSLGIRRCALAFCAVAVYLGGLVVNTAAQTPSSGFVSLRVLTYNIHHGAGNDVCAPESTGSGKPDCGLDLPRIAAVARLHKPDVIAFQEVDRFWARSAGVDQAAELASLLGMHSCYGANLKLAADLPDHESREYGTLIVSRHPIDSCNNTSLPQAAAESEQRGLLVATIKLGGQKVQIANTHLHVRREDRLLQTPVVAKALASAQTIPTVLMGDMNARPQEESLPALLTQFRDAWAVRGEGDGLTSPSTPKAPARNRIDYILVSPGIEVKSVQVDKSEAAVMASDHYPVFAELHIPKGR